MKENVKKEKALLPIRHFDDMRYEITSYLDYRKKGLLFAQPEGIAIKDGNDGIMVENIYDGRVFSRITFPKKYNQKNLRIFDIQTLSKKGKLSPKETIGLYTRKYEDLESTPNRPNEQQEKALTALYKKINASLIPLNDQAWQRKLELENKKETKQKKKSI